MPSEREIEAAADALCEIVPCVWCIEDKYCLVVAKSVLEAAEAVRAEENAEMWRGFQPGQVADMEEAEGAKTPPAGEPTG
jgi:hypothetical protein